MNVFDNFVYYRMEFTIFSLVSAIRFTGLFSNVGQIIHIYSRNCFEDVRRVRPDYLSLCSQ
jgi:hypothetical protein